MDQICFTLEIENGKELLSKLQNDFEDLNSQWKCFFFICRAQFLRHLKLEVPLKIFIYGRFLQKVLFFKGFSDTKNELQHSF